MSVYTSVYWKMPVLAQKFMGCWPYDNGVYDKCMRIIVYLALYSLIFPVGIRLFEEVGVNSDIVIENLVGQMYLNAGVIKFSMTFAYKSQHRRIFDLIARDWKMTSDEEERKIMEYHAGIGRTISLSYGSMIRNLFAQIIAFFTRENNSIFAIYSRNVLRVKIKPSTAGVFLSFPLFRPTLDVIMRKGNESHPLVLPYFAEYFVDQREYFLPLISQAVVAGFLSMVVFISFDMVFAMCVQHVCSLFDILELRLNRATTVVLTKDKLSMDSVFVEDQVYDLIKKSINLHQIVIENVNLLEDTYNLNWFFILLLNTTAIGGGLLIVILKLESPTDTFRYGMFVTAIFIHKYFIFLPGQKIINYSLNVFDHCYSSQWYDFPPKCKTLLRIMMLRSIRPLGLTGGKMFGLCMETYANMLKAGMSYFTMFANTRN